MTYVRRLTILELATLDALVKNNFIVSNAALDVRVSRANLYHVVRNIIRKYPKAEELFTTSLDGEYAVGKKRFLGLTPEGSRIYHSFIRPVLANYELLEKELS